MPGIEFRENFDIGDMGWIIQTHAEAYDKEFGWNGLGLEILTTEIVLDFAKNHHPDFERVWVAYSKTGERLGCIFVVKENESTAKIRLVFVDKKARGMGLGNQLVLKAMNFIKSVKQYEKVVLWTHSDLTSARKIYEAYGFTLVSERKHTDFGPELTGQMWETLL